MNQYNFEFERGLQALLCGTADEAERLGVLRQITDDKEAPEILSQSLRAQRISRQAFGCEDHAIADQSLRQFLNSL